MFTINKFKNGQNSLVQKNITIDEALSTIKNGDENLNTILDLRKLGKSSSLYADIKISKLPTFRFNFKFNGKASNDNIIEPTGLLYLDVDGDTQIDTTNPYIFASWKSLSETGLGILVKVDGLTKDNFKDNYIAITDLLGLKVDMNACKATQQTVLSFDNNLYENKNSITFKAINQKVSSSVIKEKKEGCIELNETFLKSSKIRFNNLGDYFIDNEDEYILFKNKEKICMPFIPLLIEEGKRNTTVFSIISQYALLNPSVGNEFLKACSDKINQYCTPRISETELTHIIKRVLKKREENTLVANFNKDRRIIFNPNTKLTAKEKQKTTAILMGKFKTDRTQQTINDAIEDWAFEVDGSITQKKIASKIGMSVPTIKRNWKPFKAFVCDLNNDFKEALVDESNVLHNDSDDVSGGLKIEPIEPFVYDLEQANAFADDFIAKSVMRRNKLIQLEKEKENEPENMIEILANSSLRNLQKAYIQLDIDTGIITTIEQLKERIAS